MFGNKKGITMVHMSLDFHCSEFHCHKVDSKFLFAFTAAAVVPCNDPKKTTDTSSMVQIMVILVL